MLRTTTAKIVDIDDWDDLVKETYGKYYSFQQQDGCKGRGTFEILIPCIEPYDYKNDTIPIEVNGDEMGVSFQSWLNTPSDKFDYLGTSKNLFWARNFYPSIEMLANDLYNKGLIEPGKYVIDIDW